MKIVRVSLERLHPDPANARLHSPRNLEAIRASLRQFGQQRPLVVQKSSGRIVAGNGTYAAMRLLGWTHCDVVMAELSDVQATGFGIADNRTSELAEWDLGVLQKLLGELGPDDFPFEQLAMGEEDLSELLKDAGGDDSLEPDSFAGDDDHETDPPAEPTTRQGDVWLMGGHRLMCGDSLDRGQVDNLIGKDVVDLVFTDPPYGMNLDTNFDAMHSKGSTHRVVGDRFAKVHGDDKAYDPTHLFEFFPNAPEVILWGADYYRKSLPDGGSWFCWDKRCDENMDKVIGNVFELAWSKRAHKREVARILWSGHHGMAKDDTKKRVHPTQKPVELILWFFARIHGKFVADLFAGSGSTLIACTRTNRNCLAMEIDPGYCDVIVTRWEKLTGKQATLEHAPKAQNRNKTA
jgi:DNA modification methylase